MKTIAESVIRRRNPSFRFDESLDNKMLFSFIVQQTFSLIRGCKLLFSFRKTRFMLLGNNVKLQNIHHMQWGRFLKLGDNVYMNALGEGKISLGNNVGIGAFSRVIISTSFNNLGSHITIGNNVGIGEFAYLGGAGGLDIGDDCIIGQYLSCHPENHVYNNVNELIRNQAVTRKGIKIGNNCWIGSKVTILDGVEIGNGCVIAAGAVVTKSFPANTVIAGVPARAINSRNNNIVHPIKAIA